MYLSSNYPCVFYVCETPSPLEENNLRLHQSLKQSSHEVFRPKRVTGIGYCWTRSFFTLTFFQCYWYHEIPEVVVGWTWNQAGIYAYEILTRNLLDLATWNSKFEIANMDFKRTDRDDGMRMLLLGDRGRGRRWWTSGFFCQEASSCTLCCVSSIVDVSVSDVTACNGELVSVTLLCLSVIGCPAHVCLS